MNIRKLMVLVLGVVVLAFAGTASAANRGERPHGYTFTVCYQGETVVFRYVNYQFLAYYLRTHEGATVGACKQSPPETVPPVIIPDTPGHTFLCMSHFGGVPVAFEWKDVTRQLAVGWFVPSATLGNSPLWDNVGPYHLICNTDGLKPTGTGLNGSGGSAADFQNAAVWKITLAYYGNPSPNHYAIYQ